jgi:phage repressor protein C with HTH and peptisase S24 domain
VLSHARIWAAIDRLAAAHDLTVSALARRAGLDPTTFNRSKRIAGDGRPRWPSTESIAKILAATQTDIGHFLALDDDGGVRRRTPATSGIPVLGLTQAGAGGYFDDSGFPTGHGWDSVMFPSDGDNVFALEVNGDSMMPLYRNGDMIIVVRDVPCRRGDRVVIKTHGGEVMAKILERRTTQSIEVISFNPDHPVRTLTVGDVEWMARIVWASQ